MTKYFFGLLTTLILAAAAPADAFNIGGSPICPAYGCGGAPPVHRGGYDPYPPVNIVELASIDTFSVNPGQAFGGQLHVNGYNTTEGTQAELTEFPNGASCTLYGQMYSPVVEASVAIQTTYASQGQMNFEFPVAPSSAGTYVLYIICDGLQNPGVNDSTLVVY